MYIDPRKPRHLGNKGQQAKQEAFAARRAAQARFHKIRLVVHGIIMMLGVWSFKHTNIHSDDPFESTTLVLMDIVFCIYMLFMVFIESWRQGNR